MRISDSIDASRIFLGLPSAPKESLIETLVDRSIASGVVLPRAAVVERLITREREASTGLGLGIAVPHATLEGVREMVLSLATVPEGAEFDAADGSPARLLILVLHPANRLGDHVRVLARIARLASHPKLIERIVAATGPEGVQEVLTALSDDDDHHLRGH